MIEVTLGITFLFAILVLSRRHGGAALGIVIMSMLLWPEYLRVPVGLVQLSAPRMVGLILLLKFFAMGRHRQINFSKVDKLVIWVWLWSILATVLAGAEFSQTSLMIGRGFDTVLMYFIARMALTTPEDVKGLYWGLAITGIFMGGMGIYEAVMAHSPYSALTGYGTWIRQGFRATEFRLGLLRAKGSTLVSIYFGMAMMLVTGLTWSVRGYVAGKFIYAVVLVAAFLGALSSMSSGPWAACFILIVLNLYLKRPSLIKPSLYLIILLSIAAEFASNRHFYNLIDYFSLDKATAWYRTRVLEVGVTHWRDFWLVGVGSNWPNHWAALIDGRDHVDVVNNFLIIALYGGLPALFMYVSTHVIAIKQIIRAWQTDKDISRRKLLFGLAATLVALDASSMSVGLYGPVLLLSHILLGLIVSASTAWSAVKVTSNSRGWDEGLDRSGNTYGTVSQGRSG